MPLSLIFACLWVLAATVTAMLPMRLQYAPGLSLLLLAVPLLVWVGYENGPWPTLIAGFAVISLFRRPLGYYIRKALGKT